MAYDDTQALEIPTLAHAQDGELVLLNPFAGKEGDIVREVVHPDTGEEMEVRLIAVLNEGNEDAAVDVWRISAPEQQEDRRPAREAKPQGQPSLGLGAPPPAEPQTETVIVEDSEGVREEQVEVTTGGPSQSVKKKAARKKTGKKTTRKKQQRQQAQPDEPEVKTGEVIVQGGVHAILPAAFHKAPKHMRDAGMSLAHVIQETSPVVQSVLPPGIALEKLHAVVGATLLAKNADKLAVCSRLSIAQALVRCATDGLVPDGEEAYIYPMPPPFGEGPMVATYVPKAQGLIRAFAREGVADRHRSCQGFEVFEGDDFDFDSFEGLRSHVPWAFRKDNRKPKKKGDKIGWVVRWRFPDGEHKDSYVPQEDILKRRDMSPMYRSEKTRARSPWKLWPKEQEWKTAVRISTKEIPKPTMLARLLARDTERGGADDPDWQPPAEDGTPAAGQLGPGNPDPMDGFEEGQ